MLHRHGVGEKLRSQFVGTCLLAIKNGLIYDRKMKTAQIIGGIRTILEDLLEGSLKKAEKLTLIDKRVLKDQDVRDMDSESLCMILDFIKTRIFPFINDKSTAGQDLLNLFFITFNKYVGKSDKNQAFTPDHITDFMAKICNVNKNSVVLDMACGSGSFLVRAMTQALADCHTQAEENEVKKYHIYGVEYDELVYGLATTNMLIHSDGNSNIVQGSCFDEVPRFIADGVKFNVVLMNPPYNAMAKQVPKDYAKTWGKSKQDPSKGLYFVKFILDQMNEHDMQGKLAVLLPMACAIGNSTLMKQMKNAILKNNTLDAVFSLPDDVFIPVRAPAHAAWSLTWVRRTSRPTARRSLPIARMTASRSARILGASSRWTRTVKACGRPFGRSGLIHTRTAMSFLVSALVRWLLVMTSGCARRTWRLITRRSRRMTSSAQ